MLEAKSVFPSIALGKKVRAGAGSGVYYVIGESKAYSANLVRGVYSESLEKKIEGEIETKRLTKECHEMEGAEDATD